MDPKESEIVEVETAEKWRLKGELAYRYRCVSRDDGSSWAVVTCDVVRADESPETNAIRDFYYMQNMLSINDLEFFDSIDEAILRHAVEFGN